MTKNVWADDVAAHAQAQKLTAVGWLDAVHTQRRFLWRGRRRDIVIFLLVAAAMMAIATLNVSIPVFHGHDQADGSMSVRFEMFSEGDFGLVATPGLLVIILSFAVMMFTSIFWALAVWSREGPRNRGYHWTMPIARSSHDLARVAAGGLWLLAGVVLMWLVVAIGLIVSGKGGSLTAVSAMGWMNYVLGPVIVYLLVSIAGVASDRAGRVVAFVYFGMIGTSILFSLVGLEPVARVFDEIMDGTLGYQRALTDALLHSVVPLVERANPIPWIWRALMWLGIAVGGVVVVARRHRET